MVVFNYKNSVFDYSCCKNNYGGSSVKRNFIFVVVETFLQRGANLLISRLLSVIKNISMIFI